MAVTFIDITTDGGQRVADTILGMLILAWWTEFCRTSTAEPSAVTRKVRSSHSQRPSTRRSRCHAVAAIMRWRWWCRLPVITCIAH